MKAVSEVFCIIEMSKNTITRQLREAASEKGTVGKGETVYYSFYLPSVDNVTAMEFFLTVIQGDVSVMVSTTVKYPSLDDLSLNNDIVFGIMNSVIIEAGDLRVGTYYIGVYGYAITDFSIGVAIRRKKATADNSTDVVIS